MTYDFRRRRAEREADAHLEPALNHCLDDSAVDPAQGEHQAKRRADGEQQRREPP